MTRLLALAEIEAIFFYKLRDKSKISSENKKKKKTKDEDRDLMIAVNGDIRGSTAVETEIQKIQRNTTQLKLQLIKLQYHYSHYQAFLRWKLKSLVCFLLSVTRLGPLKSLFTLGLSQFFFKQYLCRNYQRNNDIRQTVVKITIKPIWLIVVLPLPSPSLMGARSCADTRTVNSYVNRDHTRCALPAPIVQPKEFDAQLKQGNCQ